MNKLRCGADLKFIVFKLEDIEKLTESEKYSTKSQRPSKKVVSFIRNFS